MAAKILNNKTWSLQLIIAGRRYSIGNDPSVVQLPLYYVDRAYTLPTGGTLWTATSSGSSAGTGTNNATGCGHLYAFANCVGGDVIEMTAASTYTPVQLRNLAGGSFVYVVSSARGLLPIPGTRVGPGNASNMPKIEGVAATGAVYTEAGAHHWRFCGIEITNKSTDFVFNTVTIGASETSDATAPHHILFDRCYIHGRNHATLAGRRGMYLTGSHVGAFDSYISGYYENGQDSQAILIPYGAGPFCARNNYLEAASENIMLGGATAIAIADSIASDVEVVHNTFEKPLGWIAGGVGDVKNLFESKGGRRVLIEGNTFGNCWYGTVGAGQDGACIVLTHRDQAGNTPWMNNTDFTIRLNKMLATGAGIVIAGRDSNYLATCPVATRISVTHNQVVADGNSTGGNACSGRGFQISSDPGYLTISHNTVVSFKFPIYIVIPSGGTAYRIISNFVCKDNVFCGNGNGLATYDIIGDGQVNWNNVAAYYFTSPVFRNNAIVFATLANYSGTGNIAPASTAAMSFTNFATGVYSLQSGSPGYTAASDGTAMGADYVALDAAIA